MAVRVQLSDFDIAQEIAALRAGDARVGAIVTFIGAVRDLNDEARVSQMTLEHYPGMTEAAIGKIVVLVAVTSAHRGEAFDACRFVIDYLKTQAPFWKKEETPAGARWVDARASDDEAAARWKRDAAS